MGLPHVAADPVHAEESRKHHLHYLYRERFWACFWVWSWVCSLGLVSLRACPGGAGDAGDAEVPVFFFLRLLLFKSENITIMEPQS